MRYLGTFPDSGLHFLHAFVDHPLPEFASLSHVSEMRCQASRTQDAHAHRGMEICYVLSGRLLRISDRRRTVVLPGECCITPAGERHGGGSDPQDPCHYFSIGFDPAQVPLESLEPAPPAGGRAAGTAGASTRPVLGSLALAGQVVGVGPGMEGRFRRILAELERLTGGDGYQRRLGAMMIRTQLLEILILLLQARLPRAEPRLAAPAGASASGPAMRSAFVDLLAWLPSRMADPPSLLEMAARVRLTSTHFCAAFSREVGESPRACLARMRLAAAARALGESACSITEISRSLGYRSAQYFSQRFRSQYGLTPSQWRARQESMR